MTSPDSPRDRTTPDGLVECLRDVVLARGYTRSDEPFQLSSGGTSQDYVDLRRALSRGEDLELAARVVIAALEATETGYDAVGGLTMGADPVSHAVALLTGASWFSVRKSEKTHGTRRRIEGCLVGPGTRVVVVEDTVSTARSLLEAIEVVGAAGATVVLACTLLDRGDAAAELLGERSIPYVALLTYRDLAIAPIGASAPGGTGGETARV